MRRFTSTLMLGLFILVMASPLTVMAAPTRQDMIVSFSVSCINDNGGAVLHPGATISTSSNTYAIANVLSTLDSWLAADFLLPDRSLEENMSAWVLELQVTEPVDAIDFGGFLDHSTAANATLTATYYAVQALDGTNGTTDADTGSLFDFIIGLQVTNVTLFPDTVGGFSDRVNSSATVAATYFAIQTLVTYGHGQLSLINQSLAIAWLNSSQLLDNPASPSYGGFANGRNTTTADLLTTFMAVRSLEILGALNSINQTAVVNYILPHYRADANYPQSYGGFSLTPNDPVAIHWATFMAVATLYILDSQNQLATDDITTWILSTQTADGGFADVTGPTGFAPQTNLAVSTLALLNQLDTLLAPFGFDPYIFPWWIVGVVGLVIIIVLFVIIARRANWF